MMEKSEIITFLENAPLDESLGGAIERLVEGGDPGPRGVAALERFTASGDISSRHAALWALINFCGKSDLEAEVTSLLISALVHGDEDVALSAIGLLGVMTRSGNQKATSLLRLLRDDSRVREFFMLA